MSGTKCWGVILYGKLTETPGISLGMSCSLNIGLIQENQEMGAGEVGDRAKVLETHFCS